MIIATFEEKKPPLPSTTVGKGSRKSFLCFASMHGFLFNFVCTFLHEFNIGGAWVAWRGMAWWKN
jgi:hypothetical protein